MCGLKIYFALLFTLPCLFSFSQQSKIDSLLTLLKKDKDDTNKVNHLNALGKEIIYSNPDTSIILSSQALALSENLKWKKGIANSLGLFGVYNFFKGDYPKALDYYLKALRMDEERGDKNRIARRLGNIGLVYKVQADYPKALDYFFKALKMAEELGDKNIIEAVLGNIGLAYNDQGDYSKALDYDFKALIMAEEITNKNGMATDLGNIGLVYKEQADYPKALDYYFKALEMAKELGDKRLQTVNLGNIGALYTNTKNYKESEKYLLNALKLCQEIGAQDYERQLEEELSKLYNQTNRYQLALEHYKMAIVLKDTIFSQERQKQIMNFEFDKKEELVKAEQDKKDAVTAEASRRERVVRYSVIGGLVMMFIIAVIIFRSLRVTRKQKNVIEKQKVIVDIRNKEIEEQKKLVEEKNKDITDSINYAQRIQRAMLPHRRDIWAAFPQSFVLFKPKDIVSGDFYYFHAPTLKGEKTNAAPAPFRAGGDCFFIAACDCTGHGVPGAFMSMIGSDKLEDAVLQSTDTSEILSLLNKGVKTALKQSSESNESTRDGMDIALVKCKMEDGKGQMVVEYAGANRPIWIIRKGATSVEEIKATKKAIGGFTEDNQHFDSHEIKLQEGDVFYLSTDGYADTFGKDGKKMMTKHFKEVLLGIQHKTMKEQEKHLDEFVENWKSGTEQVDDILVIGIKI